MKSHKWAKEIKAWADGEEIEFRYVNRLIHKDDWEYCDYPDWNDNEFVFRIKPQPKEPQYLYVYADFRGDLQITDNTEYANSHKVFGKIKLEADDETETN